MNTATIEAPAAVEKGLTIKETAAALRVHPQTIYRLVWDGLLGYEKRGNRYLIYPRHIRAYREAGASDTASGGGANEPSGTGPSGPAGTRPK